MIVLSGKGQVSAGAGADLVCGSPSADVILGGPGDDVILGGPGGDTVRGGTGSDRLYGDSGDDRVSGGAGADQLYGATGTDSLSPGAGQDMVATDGTVVLLTASATDVQMMRMAGVRFAVAAGSLEEAQAVWATADPMSSMSFVLGPQLAGFAAAAGGGRIEPFVQADVSLGANFALEASNTVTVNSNGTPGQIRLVNNSSAVSQLGLLGRAIVNGWADWGVVSVSQTLPGTQFSTTAPRSAVLFTSSGRTNDTISAVPGNGVDIDLAAGNTVSLTYANGRFTRR